MKCNNCGAANPDGENYCGTCGKPLAKEQSNTVDSYVPIADQYPKNTAPQYQNVQQPIRLPERTRVVVTDFDMPFSSLVNFMVKVALASIPASIVVAIIYGITLFCILTTLGVLDGAGRR